jgi:hypothetical protein
VKIAAIGAAIFALLLPSAAAVPPGVAKIKLTGVVISENRYQRIYSLWNKPAYQQKLGTGFQTCVPVGEDFTDCYMTLRLGRGQIVTRGVSPTVSSFRQLAVVGGTGYYSNVGGQMTIQGLGPQTILLLLDLTAF